MQVQVNTGNGLEGKETLELWATDFLNESLARFRGDITRVEVQLTDEARGKQGPDDMHCTLEARLAGLQPVAVSHNAPGVNEAIRGATQKLIHSLEHVMGKLDRQNHRTRDTIRKEPIEDDAR